MSTAQEPPSLLQTVDAEVQRRVRGMVRTARYGALAWLDPDTGAPMVSRIGLATDVGGVSDLVADPTHRGDAG
jgi:hypothetical protein